MKKKIGIGLFLIILIGIVKFVYDVNINHNFREIDKDKVYKSGVIPPEEIEGYVKKYNIKSIIDLRMPGTKDMVNNPEIEKEIITEEEAVKKLEGINYFNVPSEQVPSKETLSQYFKIMDNPENYPVLIHCYHGEGRAPLFAALYQIEYEGFSNEEARNNTRFLVKWSSFDNDKPKGEFLKHYQRRK